MDGANDLIFISIAAYRDLQLAFTVEDCLAKARFPDRLRFGICWQHGQEEDLLPFPEDDRFRVKDVNWQESEGACWARAEVMKLWRGEVWFLQVDSHCRFASHWDDRLIAMMRRTESAKPILSTYASPFTPGDLEVLHEGPLQMAFQGFTQEGIPHMKPLAIPMGKHGGEPMRARFLSAGFLFAPGSFVLDVGYDAELYFLGEEAAMTVRAYTHGYDLFHPCETMVWHDYVRKDAAKHWDDHTGANEISRDWSELDRKSKDKVRRLLAGMPVDSYGLGPVRTLREYEEYAGLSFALRKAQDYTTRCEEPPNPEAAADWADFIYPWIVRVRVERAALPQGSLDDPSFWFVGVHDEGGNEIYRRDVAASELAALVGDQQTIELVCEFQSGSAPIAWTVWPVSRSMGWLRRINGSFADGDFAILEDEEG